MFVDNESIEWGIRSHPNVAELAELAKSLFDVALSHGLVNVSDVKTLGRRWGPGVGAGSSSSV